MSFRPRAIATCGLLCLVSSIAAAQVVDPKTPVPEPPTQAETRQVRPIGFGIKGGVNHSTLALEVSDDLPITATWGGIGGLFLVGEVTPSVAFQIEALYSQRGVEDDVPIAEAKVRLTYVDIPVTARWSTPSTGSTRFHVFTGPQLGIKVKAQIINDQLDLTTTVSDQFKDWDLGWTIGAGVSVDRISFDGRYTHGLTDINATDTGWVKNRTFTLLVGIQFR